jgi:TolB protein
MSRAIALKTISLAAAVLASVAATPMLASASARSRILYTSDNLRSIVSIRPTGGDLRVLYHPASPTRVSSPSASRNGHRIAFLSSVNANRGGPGPPRTVDKLFIARRDGSHRRLVRRFVDLDVRSLAISPSGRRLVFSRQRSIPDSTQHIYAVRASGRGLRRVTTSSASATDPQFSPGGKRIVFTKEGRRRNGIATVKFTGGPGHLIYRSASASEPSYSPDGERIAFVNARGSNLYHLWLMRSNGRRAHPLIRNRSQQFNPSFSPSGNSLVFEEESFSPLRFTLQTVRRNGSNRMLLRRGGHEPVWVR